MVQNSAGSWGSVRDNGLDAAHAACRAMNYVGADASMYLNVNTTIRDQYYSKYILSERYSVFRRYLIDVTIFSRS